MKEEIFIIIGSAIAFIAITYINYTYFGGTNVIAGVSLLTSIAPYLIYKSIRAARAKKMEDIFNNFLFDLGNIMETKISLVQAMGSMRERDYGILSPYIKKLYVDISWGVPFFDAFVKMGKSTKSKLIDKSISVIIGSFVSGGNLKKIFNAVGLHVRELTKVKETVRSKVKTIIITTYLIFFGLLFSLIIIKENFLPALTTISKSNEALLSDTNQLLFYLIIIQAFFAGIVTGEMAEGNAFVGVKHSLVLVSMAIIVYGLFT